MDKLEKQQCPMCGKKTLTLIEDQTEVPYFGNCFLLSMKCSSCNYNISDVEAATIKDPARYTIETDSEKDMKIRVVKSSTATVKIPTLKITITPGPASIGYISNIEGLLDRVKNILESQRDNAEENSAKKTAKNLLKKLWKGTLGDVKIKIIIEDPSGNSAIISDKAKVEKLKK
jgi:zinc finger protein